MWTFATWQHILSVNQTFLTSLSYKTKKKRKKEKKIKKYNKRKEKKGRKLKTHKLSQHDNLVCKRNITIHI